MVKGCSVIDLFCGAGGLTHGFVQEGFRVLAGVDSDVACKYAYEANNPKATFIHKNIEEVGPKELGKLYPRNHVKILVGCAPCQPFSQYTKKRVGQGEKWKLLTTFADIVGSIQPDIISMENVIELLSFKKGEIYNEFVEHLKASGYHVSSYKVYCPDYGVPQQRTRLVLFASKDKEIKLTPATHTPNQYINVRKAIGHLPKISAGEVCSTDLLHRASNLSEKNLQRIRQSHPGGTWHDWEPHLIAECHKKKTGESYKSVYGRMDWLEPAPTMTTQCNGYGNGRFGHPEQDRAISMREAAIFQSFPNDYQFLNPNKHWNIETLARLIGNAVPVKLGQAIARSIKEHIGR